MYNTAVELNFFFHPFVNYVIEYRNHRSSLWFWKEREKKYRELHLGWKKKYNIQHSYYITILRYSIQTYDYQYMYITYRRIKHRKKNAIYCHGCAYIYTHKYVQCSFFFPFWHRVLFLLFIGSCQQKENVVKIIMLHNPKKKIWIYIMVNDPWLRITINDYNKFGILLLFSFTAEQ